MNAGFYWNADGSSNSIEGITYPDDSPAPPSPPPPIPQNTNTAYGFFYSDGAVGMPLGWSGTTDMSGDGYNNPYGSYCYIGFECKSPNMADHASGTNNPYYYFPYNFYQYALGYWNNDGIHHSVKDSLIRASWETFGTTYIFSPFYTGYWYYSYDPVMQGWYHCTMRLLGNGNLNLPY